MEYRGRGGIGYLEDRRLAMPGLPGLRGRVIAALCEEWPNPDNEVHNTTIYERLKRAGDVASEDEVRQELLQLADHGNITLGLVPSRGSGPVVVGVDPELCP
jgi:hypothetical protein